MSSRLVTVKNELHDLLEQEADMTRDLDKLRERIRQTRLEISRMGARARNAVRLWRLLIVTGNLSDSTRCDICGLRSFLGFTISELKTWRPIVAGDCVQLLGALVQ